MLTGNAPRGMTRVLGGRQAAEHLIALRRESHLSPAKFAERLGVNEFELELWESGDRHFDAEVLWTAARVAHSPILVGTEDVSRYLGRVTLTARLRNRWRDTFDAPRRSRAKRLGIGLGIAAVLVGGLLSPYWALGWQPPVIAVGPKQVVVWLHPTDRQDAQQDAIQLAETGHDS
jgi:transcriptional regulator with XRE-family HTH domain